MWRSHLVYTPVYVPAYVTAIPRLHVKPELIVVPNSKLRTTYTESNHAHALINNNNNNIMSAGIRESNSLVPRPHPQKEEEGLVTFERFLGSCKLSILTFVKANQIAAPQFSCDLASGRAACNVSWWFSASQ